MKIVLDQSSEVIPLTSNLSILRFIVIIGIVLNLFVGTPAWASSLTLEEPAGAINPNINSVIACGEWKHGDYSGYFRIITGWLYGHSEIYVQWIAWPEYYPPPGQPARATALLVKSVSFPRFDNYEAATDLTTPVCKKVGGRYQIVSIADNGHDDTKSTIIIKLYDEPGKYELIEKPLPKPLKKKPK
jgi:hypothetical protein